MLLLSWATTLRTRLARFQRKLGVAAAFFARLPGRLKNTNTQRRVFIVMSRIFFIILLILLLSCTAIDVLKQSFRSGQFWNSIIVIITFSIIIIYSLLLSLIRRVNTNRWLAAIPRRSQVGRSDIGGNMVRKINETRHRCRFLFKNQLDFSTIDHLGAQNPLKRGEGQQDIEIPFWEIADTIPSFFEGNVTIIMPELHLTAGQSLREYIDTAVSEQLLNTESIGDEIQEFIDSYEVLRYSGKSVSYNDLLRMMTALVAVNNHLQPSDYAQLYAISTGTTTNSGSSMASVRIHNTAYPSRRHLAVPSGDLTLSTEGVSASNSMYSSASKSSDEQ